jgi:hypothetical protein
MKTSHEVRKKKKKNCVGQKRLVCLGCFELNKKKNLGEKKTEVLFQFHSFLLFEIFATSFIDWNPLEWILFLKKKNDS